MLTTGLFAFSPDDPMAGQLFPQRTVRRNGTVGLFDDVAGRGFLLLARRDPRPFLSRNDDAFIEHVGMHCVRLTRDPNDALALVDEAGEYQSFFASNGLEAVIVRPDRYVFGGVRNLGNLSGLMAKLRHMLAMP
jgi:flavoprotein hydroxylase